MGPTDSQEGFPVRGSTLWGELLQKWGFSYRNFKQVLYGDFRGSNG